jgi:hypothetical protein
MMAMGLFFSEIVDCIAGRFGSFEVRSGGETFEQGLIQLIKEVVRQT